MVSTEVEIFLFCLVFIGGYLIIFVAADKLIDCLCDVAKIMHISPFLIGLLIVGIDPEECIASIIAAAQNYPHIAIGNIIGNTVIALTLCFAIPLLFVSKSDLDALCKLNQLQTDNNINENDNDDNDIELGQQKTNIIDNKPETEITRFKKADRYLIPIFYYLLLIFSVIIIALNSVMYNFQYNLLITGCVNLFGFILYLCRNIYKYKTDKSMDVIIDPSDSESSSSSSSESGSGSSSSSSSSDSESNDKDNDKNPKKEQKTIKIKKEKKKENGFIRILKFKCVPVKTRKILFSIFWLLCICGGGELLVYSSEELIERISFLNESIFGYLIISFVTNIEEITLIVKSIRKNSFHIGLGGMIGKMYFNLNFSYGICGFLLFYMKWTLLDMINSLILVFVMIYLCAILYFCHFRRNHGIMLMFIFIAFYVVNILFQE